MEGPEQVLKSRVVKVDSEESWDILVTQANNQGCPLYCCFMLLQTDYLRPVSLIIFLRVLVHFTAAWCMPSVAMNPLFEELAMNYQDVLFLLVDVDEVKEVASKMDIKAMPTFLLMRDGTQVDKLVGANPEEIRKRIDGFVQSIRSQ